MDTYTHLRLEWGTDKTSQRTWCCVTVSKSRMPQGEAGRKGGPGEAQPEQSPRSPREQGLFDTVVLNSFAKPH